MYQVLSPIATALYGDIVKGIATHDGSVVAIKRIFKRNANRTACGLLQENGQENVQENVSIYENAQENVMVERNVISALALNSNPYLLEAMEQYEDDTYLYIVMEYCPKELFTVIQASGAFNMQTAVTYFKMIVSGLKHLHMMGYAHRDVSLENILINDAGNCKIIDFGLATQANVRSNDIVGEPMYMAPEMLLNENYCPKSADMWSLGIVLFIMTTGYPPFTVAQSHDLRYAHVQRFGIRKLLETWQLLNTLPDCIVHVMKRLLLPDPASRAQCQEILDILHQRSPPLSL